MPIFKIQREALAAIAANRHPGSHIAGGIVINADGHRFSKDIDIFHDLIGSENRVRLLKESVDVDAVSLAAAGFELVWDAVRPEFYRGIIGKDGDRTVLEWVVDSDFRFFDALQDETFGYRLDMFDLATNKVLAAASRKEARDVVDLIHIHADYFPLGTAIWAAPAKDPGCTPESLIEDIKRNCVYRQDDFDRVMSDTRIDAKEVSIALKSALRQAGDFVASMPSGYDGMAFLEDGHPVEPDVARLDAYQLLEAKRQSHWPSSPQIGSEMIGIYRKPEGH